MKGTASIDSTKPKLYTFTKKPKIYKTKATLNRPISCEAGVSRYLVIVYRSAVKLRDGTHRDPARELSR